MRTSTKCFFAPGGSDLVANCLIAGLSKDREAFIVNGLGNSLYPPDRCAGHMIAARGAADFGTNIVPCTFDSAPMSETVVFAAPAGEDSVAQAYQKRN